MSHELYTMGVTRKVRSASTVSNCDPMYAISVYYHQRAIKYLSVSAYLPLMIEIDHEPQFLQSCGRKELAIPNLKKRDQKSEKGRVHNLLC
jgi:hypothetical protein